MKREKLISFAMSFVSFLVDRARIERVILYGSVAADNFDGESDIDLFVEVDDRMIKRVKDLLTLYRKSKNYEKFRLEGVKNDISVKCGKLDEWKDLKRSIVSGGIVLYGRYEGEGEKLKHKILFMTELESRLKSEKIKIWRKLYGYQQKVGKKVYVSEGLAEKKIGRGAFLCSLDRVDEVKNYFKKEKIRYRLMDIWIESF